MRKVASPQMLRPAGAAAITGLRSDEAQRLREQTARISAKNSVPNRSR
jgi:hypothetical protein